MKKSKHKLVCPCCKNDIELEENHSHSMLDVNGRITCSNCESELKMDLKIKTIRLVLSVSALVTMSIVLINLIEYGAVATVSIAVVAVLFLYLLSLIKIRLVPISKCN